MNLPTPTQDTPILPWALAVTQGLTGSAPTGVAGMMTREGPGGTGYEPIAGNDRHVVPDEPLPFEVRWSYDEEAEDGEWAIYLPDGAFEAKDPQVATAWQTYFGGLQPSGMGDNWYLIDVGGSSGTVYLNVSGGEESEGSSATVMISTSKDGDVANIPIAALSVDATSDRHYADPLWVGSIYIEAGVSDLDVPVDDVSIEDSREVPVEEGEAETVSELAVKGWHTVDAETGDDNTLVADLGLPQDAGNTGYDDAVLRATNAANALKYRRIGKVDRSKILGSMAEESSGATAFYDLNGNKVGMIEIPEPESPGDGKLYVKIGDGEAVDTGFSANAENDGTINLPEIPAAIKYPTSGISYVGAVRYDISTHQLQCRIDTWNPATGVVTPGAWEMITGGQCTPHSAETEA